ncbi:MAG: TrkH family potassium uptake protein [Bacteroidetes bacterium]|nr:TrkH family potassium uptake protein [Rhodothermia bacterium]MCS7155664.1 TrkH family potassium uptake protein [Bacteroidota bacterium]MCX7906523.1 TrkH family potassium uptake protein [Bacteroidota bacterium]MDW8137196.1 TrkH family potassium uptake protein [Bacteroidota bacterium]MDW8284934.1 TrkH family potassium uptake protein [Bacteroidota bacterium]
MDLSRILRTLGALLFFDAAAMGICGLLGLAWDDAGASPLLRAAAVGALCGAFLYAWGLRRRRSPLGANAEGLLLVPTALGPREATLIAALGWLLVPMLGGLPYRMAGVVPTWTDAYFEAVSGFTTTGSSVIASVESLPASLLLWRALTHWLGGLGIVLLVLLVLPALGIGGLALYQLEASQVGQEKLAPRMHQTGLILWSIYALLTVSLALLLRLGGMSWFEAITHSFAAIATGGFSTRNTSYAAFESAYLELITALFMFLASCNFGFFYWIYRGRWDLVRRSRDVAFYALSTLISTLLVSAYLVGSGVYGSWPQALRYGVFQVVSLHSTTGFASADYETWGAFPQWWMLLLMLMGGCAGSTAGAIKNIRILVLVKYVVREVRQFLFPRAVLPIRIGAEVIPEPVVQRMVAYVGVYMGFVLLGSALVTATGVDIMSALSGAIATMGGVGPGIGLLGPMDNYGSLPEAAKWVYIVLMYLGRLEIFTLLALFSPEIWRGHP